MACVPLFTESVPFPVPESCATLFVLSPKEAEALELPDCVTCKFVDAVNVPAVWLMLSEESVTEPPVTEPARLIAVGVLEPLAAVPLAVMDSALLPTLTEPVELTLTLPALAVIVLGALVEDRAPDIPTSPVVAVMAKPAEETV